MKHGKKYVDSVKLIDSMTAYDPADAVALVCQTAKAKFDETIEISARLGVDPRHADQMVRSSVILPNGTGKTARVLVFAKGEKEKEALAAGADFAGAITAADEDAAIAWPADAPKVGDLVWLQPGHIDPTINLYDAPIVVDEDGSSETWPVDARRSSR